MPLTIFKNFKYLVFAQVISQAFGFFTVVYIARILGASGFGVIVFAQTLSSYFFILTDLGTTKYGMREVARTNVDTINYTINIITIRIVLTIISFTLIVCCALIIDREYVVKMVIILFGLTLFANMIFVDWVFKGLEQMQYVAVASVIERASYFVLIMALVNKDTNILLIPIIYLAGNILASVYLLYVLGNKYNYEKLPNAKTDVMKQILCMSLPLALSSLMVRVNNNVDTLFLGIMKNDEVVGYYNAAYKIILVIFLVGGYYVTAIFPVASRMFHNSIRDLENLLSNSVRVLLSLGIPMAFGGIILGQQIITTVYGSKYLSSVVPLQVLCIYIPISFITMVYADSLIACDMQKQYAVGMTISAIVNILTNVILIPPFGMIGAALATITSEIVLFIYSFYNLSKLVKVGFVKQSVVPTVCSIIMCIALMYIHCNIISMIAIGVIVYMCSMVIFKGVSVNEIVVIKDMILDRN